MKMKRTEMEMEILASVIIFHSTLRQKCSNYYTALKNDGDGTQQ